jgi:5'-deoxynucleotidase YfbR-like HD superfamily hydrolase
MERMRPTEPTGILEFLRSAERLKITERSACTTTGAPESAAEHTWRLCLKALVLAPEFPDIDFAGPRIRRNSPPVQATGYQ